MRTDRQLRSTNTRGLLGSILRRNASQSTSSSSTASEIESSKWRSAQDDSSPSWTDVEMQLKRLSVISDPPSSDSSSIMSVGSVESTISSSSSSSSRSMKVPSIVEKKRFWLKGLRGKALVGPPSDSSDSRPSSRASTSASTSNGEPSWSAQRNVWQSFKETITS